MGRPRTDLEQLTATWQQIAGGQIVEDTVSYRAAVRILIERLAALVRPGQAIQPYVHAMLAQGYRRATAYHVVRAAFAIAAERMVQHAGARPKAARTVAPAPDCNPGTTAVSVAIVPSKPERVLKPAPRPPVPRPSTAEATPAERGAAHRQECAGRAPLRADPAYYGVYGRAAFGARPGRYFHEDPKLPVYVSAAYPMTDVGVPVLDRAHWMAPFGVDDAEVPLAPYGVTPRYGYPVQHTGVPPGSNLSSPQDRFVGEEGWDDW